MRQLIGPATRPSRAARHATRLAAAILLVAAVLPGAVSAGGSPISKKLTLCVTVIGDPDVTVSTILQGFGATRVGQMRGVNIVTMSSGVNGVATPGPDLFCGASLGETVIGLSSGDWFYGGQGDDYVTDLTGATFVGNAGNDFVTNFTAGSFQGSMGADYVTTMNPAVSTVSFFGGSGGDYVTTLSNGTFYGDDGVDYVSAMANGSFNAGAGNDYVTTQNNGGFYGEADDDSVTTLNGGFFDGGTGNNTVGTVNNFPGCANVSNYTCL